MGGSAERIDWEGSWGGKRGWVCGYAEGAEIEKIEMRSRV